MCIWGSRNKTKIKYIKIQLEILYYSTTENKRNNRCVDVDWTKERYWNSKYLSYTKALILKNSKIKHENDKL